MCDFVLGVAVAEQRQHELVGRRFPGNHPVPHFAADRHLAGRPFTGEDPKVRKYIRSFPQTGEFLRRIEGLLTYLIPHYIREGKSYLTIAFGCTGGRHRSVMLAESVKESLVKRGFSAKVIHRDIEK